METSGTTRLLAILGDPVGHSLSPALQNAAIHALGLDAVYVALRTPATAFDTVLKALAAVGGAGNVTVPHKEAAERSVTRKTDLCARVGACNTFWTENGTLVGDNTDVHGITMSLRSAGADGAGRWLVIGTGGAARAVAIAAGDAKARLVVRSRDPNRARGFVDWAKTRNVNAEAAADGAIQCDLAVNATPLGLRAGDALPLAPDVLRETKAAMDLVYAAGETAWVRALRAAGVRAADGRELLVQQGAAAFERFFPGEDAPVEVMRAAVSRALRA